MKLRKHPEGLRAKRPIAIDKLALHHAAVAYSCRYLGSQRLVIEGPPDDPNAIRSNASLIPFDAPIFRKD